jgi:uncharacterized oligopeptide transporter (OPT) family protein
VIGAPSTQPVRSGPDDVQNAPRWKWLPPVGSKRYHLLLLAVGMLVLGPLCGVTSSFMNFSLGFFVGGSVLAGILGSAVTYGYGAEGRHGANFMQTTAASVAGMAALGVIVQAMVWLGVAQPPLAVLIAYILSAGMFGVGVGMLYTPLLVDRMQLTFPSGLAVAVILRALTDRDLLRRSIRQLGGATLLGVVSGTCIPLVPVLARTGASLSTLGAGMVVGPRVALPSLGSGIAFALLTPAFVAGGWLLAGDPPRKISYLIALGFLLGAALVDMGLASLEAWKRWRTLSTARAITEQVDLQSIDGRALILWITVWAVAIVVIGVVGLHEPVAFLIVALVMVFVFALVIGISQGVSDAAPTSSAFVITVLILVAFGLSQPTVGLMVAASVLVATEVACDMQQDRSTGRRLGTNRTTQFCYQVAGVIVGALLAVGFAKLYMTAYPVLQLDQTAMTAVQQPHQWNASMTYKIVGTLRSLAGPKTHQQAAIAVGVGVGLLLALVRLFVKNTVAYRRFAIGSRTGKAVDFIVDCFVLPSPYALAFGGFVGMPATYWFAGGGLLSLAIGARSARVRAREGASLPEDMSATALLGGGLIAGDSLAALGLGLFGLVATLGR